MCEHHKLAGFTCQTIRFSGSMNCYGLSLIVIIYLSCDDWIIICDNIIINLWSMYQLCFIYFLGVWKINKSLISEKTYLFPWPTAIPFASWLRLGGVKIRMPCYVSALPDPGRVVGVWSCFTREYPKAYSFLFSDGQIQEKGLSYKRLWLLEISDCRKSMLCFRMCSDNYHFFGFWRL